MKRKGLQITAIVSLLILAGCMNHPQHQSVNHHPIRIAFVSCVKNAKFFEPVKKGMNDAAKMLGVQCDFLGTEGVDIPAQAKIVTQAVKDGYDGIAVNIIDPRAFDEVISQAIERGVPVVGFNVDDQDTDNARLSSVNQQLKKAGVSLGQHLADFIPANSHILITMHDEGVSALIDRRDGIQQALQDKNIKWTEKVIGSDSQHAVEVVTQTLKANPDIHIVIGTGQSDTEAAGIALQANFTKGAYWSAGFDLSPRTLNLIQQGYIRCTVDQQPYVQGFYPVVQLTQYLRYGIMPADINAGATIIDKTNAGKVLELTEQNYR